MKTIYITGCMILLVLGGLFPGPQPAHAQGVDNFRIETRTNVTVDAADSKLDMTHTVTVANQTDAALPTMDFALPVRKAENLQVVYMDGSDIPFETTQQQSRAIHRQFQHTTLQLDFPRDIQSEGKTWRFKVSYTTPERIQTIGGSATVGVPLLDGGVADSWRATIDAPLALPDVNYYPPASRVSLSDDRQQLVFRSKDVGRNFLGVSFMASQTHTLHMNTELRNTLPFAKTVSFTLPPDLHNQSVFINSIKPQPDEVRVDRNGNTIADYRLWPFERVNISTTTTVRTRQLRYDPAGAKPASDTPETLTSYTKAGEYRPVEGAVAQRGQDVVNESATAWKKIRQLHTFVQNEFTLESGGSERIPADRVLEARSGNVYNIADTLIALLRSQEIPARMVEGFVYPDNSPMEDQRAHAWVEAYVAGVGWVTLDPVWSEMYGSFGYSSSDRVAVRTMNGNSELWDEAYPLSDMEHSLRPKGTLPERENPADQVRVDATRRIVFPGIVHDQRTVHNDSGYIIDNVRVEETFMGSLAPQANISREEWRLAGFNPNSIQWHVGDQAPATVTSRVTWWPMAIPVVLLVTGGVIQFYRHRFKRYLRKRLGGAHLH